MSPKRSVAPFWTLMAGVGIGHVPKCTYSMGWVCYRLKGSIRLVWG